MKQYILRSSLGGAALYLRDKLEIVKVALHSPEDAGMMANDQMAFRLITRICERNKTFIDVGAHIGSVLSEVKRRDPTIKLIAIEAIPQKVERLRRNFPGLELHECAAGDASGEISFFIDLKQSGYSSLGKAAHINADRLQAITVPIKRLDEIILINDADAIKIDVEGAELGVLRGAINLLKKCRPVIMFESAPKVEDGLGYSKEAMYEFLTSNGFSILAPNRVAHDDPGLSMQGFLESHWYPRRTTNYFAVPTERRIEIRDKAQQIVYRGLKLSVVKVSSSC
jgi:FkbM family methyltransferase